MYPAPPLQIRLADNSSVHSYTIAEVPVTIGDRNRRYIKFRVMPKLTHNCILGMEWLREANPTINWRTKTVELPGAASHESSQHPRTSKAKI